MIFLIFAIKDSALEEFSNPQYFMAEGQARRSFTDEVRRVADDNPLSKHPEDFSFYYLGSYETKEAKFEAGPPRLVLRAIDCLSKSS